jgi:hypothetical protein
MSQFRTLSASFKDALESLGEELAKKKEDSGKPVGLDHVRAFFEGPVRNWYESLETADRSEVDRLFKELNDLSPDDVIGLMKAEKHASPFGLVGGLFRVAENGKNSSVTEV